MGKAIYNIKYLSEELYSIRKIIEEKETENKAQMEALKLERDLVQEKLLKVMKKDGLLSLKVSNGDSFFIGTRKGYEIINEAQAFDWAYKNKAVSVNKTIVGQILKESGESPPGFKLVENEFISIRKKKEK